MTNRTLPRPARNGHAPPARRWILSAPVPLPALGDYSGMIAVYDLDRAMAFTGWGAIAADLQQRFREIERQKTALLAAHTAAWPAEQQTDEAFFAADHAVGDQIRALNREQIELNRAMNLRALAEFVVEVQSPADGTIVSDPTDPQAWEGWSNHMLEWLTSDKEGHGLWLARDQLIGKKAPPASATPSR